MSELLNQIKEKEVIARRLQTDSDMRNGWMEKVEAYTNWFISTMPGRNAFEIDPSPAFELEDKAGIGEPKTIEEVLGIIAKSIDGPGINPASGGHLGYIPGGGVYPAAIGDFIAAISNRYAGVWFANPGAVKLENELIKWLNDLIGYPDTAHGNLTSGGSIANLIAIVTARDARGVKAIEIPRSVIYLTKQAHHSLIKAIRIAGLSECVIRELPVDGRFRMDMDVLEEQINSDIAQGLKPFLLLTSLGTTDTGAIDPLTRSHEISKKHGLWWHLDGAYGGFFVLSDLVKNLSEGIALSDSFTIDPHKGLFLPYGTGAVLIKDVDALMRTHYYSANYMQDALKENIETSPADLSPELTKHFRGLRMWLPLQLFGLEPFKAALDEKILLCRYFYQKIGEMGFERGPYPELSVCIYRFIPGEGDSNAFNRELVQHIHEDGRVFISSTSIDGDYWLRMAILSFRTHLDTIDLALEVIEKALKAVQNSIVNSSTH
jgi:glutamate/tyrosine decarboxylase-like PLP-dependent enzyme